VAVWCTWGEREALIIVSVVEELFDADASQRLNGADWSITLFVLFCGIVSNGSADLASFTIY
jgi:hypothetical protein